MAPTPRVRPSSYKHVGMSRTSSRWLEAQNGAFCTFLLKSECINSIFCSASVFNAPDSTAHVGRMELGDNPTRNIVHSSHHQVYLENPPS